MIITYTNSIVSNNLTASPTITSSIGDADFLLLKNSEWLRCKVTDNTVNTKTKVFKKVVKKGNLELHTNTSNILLTNVIINDIPYFYKLETLNLNDNLKTIINLANIKDLATDGVNYYTNSKIFYRHSDSVVLYSEPVVDLTKALETRYTSQAIILAFDANLAYKLSNSVVEPFVIDNYKIQLPDFYLTDNYGKIVNRFIATKTISNMFEIIPEGCIDIQLTSKAIESLNSYEICKPLNRLINTETGGYSTYKAVTTTHDFYIDDVAYFKIQNNSLILTDSLEDSDFYIEQIIDMSLIEVVANPKESYDYSTYKDNTIFNLIPSEFVESSDTGLKTTRLINYIFPSESNYIDDIYIATNTLQFPNVALNMVYPNSNKHISYRHNGLLDTLSSVPEPFYVNGSHVAQQKLSFYIKFEQGEPQ
jgi:hypothetical protein